MNKDDAREAARQKALDELHAKQFVEGRDLRFYGAGFDKGFDAGAASVDRKAIVEEAFEKVRVEAKARNKGLQGQYIWFLEGSMDAILAEMGGEE